MIQQTLILALFAIFADLLMWKVGVWRLVKNIHYKLSIMVECEFCRSFWTCAILFAPLVLFSDICIVQDLFIIILATPVKLAIHRQI